MYQTLEFFDCCKFWDFFSNWTTFLVKTSSSTFIDYFHRPSTSTIQNPHRPPTSTFDYFSKTPSTADFDSGSQKSKSTVWYSSWILATAIPRTGSAKSLTSALNRKAYLTWPLGAAPRSQRLRGPRKIQPPLTPHQMNCQSLCRKKLFRRNS